MGKPEQDNRKAFVKIAKSLLLLVMLLGIIIVVKNNIDIFNRLSQLNFLDIFFLITINILLVCQSANIQHVLLKSKSIYQTKNECIGLSLISAFYNLFVPAKGGSVGRYLYLNKKYNISKQDFIVFLATQSVLISVVSLILLAMAVGAIYLEISIYYCLLLAIPLIALNFFLKAKKTNRKSTEQGQKTSFSFIVKNLPLSGVITFIFLRAISFYIAFSALNVHITPSQALISAALVIITNQVSIVPGNLGVREFVLGFGLSLYDFNLGVVILASLLDRAANIIVVIIGATYFKYRLFFSDDIERQ